MESGNGGTFAEPVRSFKLNSTIPIKFTLFAGGCGGSPIVTGIYALQMIKYANAVDSEPAIDATPTDAATTGNQFRLSDTEWVYNMDTKRTPGISSGTWLVRATLFDGSVKTAGSPSRNRSTGFKVESLSRRTTDFPCFMGRR